MQWFCNTYAVDCIYQRFGSTWDASHPHLTNMCTMRLTIKRYLPFWLPPPLSARRCGLQFPLSGTFSRTPTDPETPFPLGSRYGLLLTSDAFSSICFTYINPQSPSVFRPRLPCGTPAFAVLRHFPRREHQSNLFFCTEPQKLHGARYVAPSSSDHPSLLAHLPLKSHQHRPYYNSFFRPRR